MSQNILYIMLMKEILNLRILNWFEPIGSKLEKLLNYCHDKEAEGISRKEVLFLRSCNNKISNLPDNMKKFLHAIGSKNEQVTIVLDGILGSESAIESFIWKILIESEITEKKIEIIEKIWYEIMGYYCPFSLREN